MNNTLSNFSIKFKFIFFYFELLYLSGAKIFASNQQFRGARVCLELGVMPPTGGPGDPGGLVLCSVDVEPLSKAPLSQQQNPLLRGLDIIKEIKETQETSPSPSNSSTKCPQTSTVPPPKEDKDDVMLDRITHDLDYLLNRSEEETPKPVPVVKITRSSNEYLAGTVKRMTPVPEVDESGKDVVIDDIARTKC